MVSLCLTRITHVSGCSGNVPYRTPPYTATGIPGIAEQWSGSVSWLASDTHTHTVTPSHPHSPMQKAAKGAISHSFSYHILRNTRITISTGYTHSHASANKMR